VDTLTAERRSENMGRIRSHDTSPELQVRRFLHSRGLRYRLHVKDLPGKPDLVFPALRTCVFVHGCFWHGCPKCIDGTRKVRSRTSYWIPKIAGNRVRDAAHAQALSQLGWKVLTVWECEVRDRSSLKRLARLLTLRTKTHEKRSAPRAN
jgi:DNA mismatch endonuclease (patch repair protein)